MDHAPTPGAGAPIPSPPAWVPVVWVPGPASGSPALPCWTCNAAMHLRPTRVAGGTVTAGVTGSFTQSERGCGAQLGVLGPGARGQLEHGPPREPHTCAHAHGPHMLTSSMASCSRAAAVVVDVKLEVRVWCVATASAHWARTTPRASVSRARRASAALHTCEYVCARVCVWSVCVAESSLGLQGIRVCAWRWVGMIREAAPT
jgi:hypothetical protein